MDAKYPDIQKAENFAQIEWQDQPEQIQAEACAPMAEMLRGFVDGAKSEKKLLKFCQTASPDQILKNLLSKGRLQKVDAFCRYFKDLDEDLVLIDQSGRMGAVKIENNKLVGGNNPEWLNALVLYKENRKIAYADRTQNFRVDYHADKHRFKHAAKANQRTIFNSKQAQRKRSADYYDANDNKSSSEDRNGYNTRDTNHEVGYSAQGSTNNSQWE